MPRTYTVTVTTILNNGMQAQSNYFTMLSHEHLAVVETSVDVLVREELTLRHRDARWFIVVMAGDDYGFIVKKYNGDGTFANEMVDKE